MSLIQFFYLDFVYLGFFSILCVSATDCFSSLLSADLIRSWNEW